MSPPPQSYKFLHDTDNFGREASLTDDGEEKSMLELVNEERPDFHTTAEPTPASSSRLPDEDDPASATSRRWAVTLFSLTTILLFADQNLMAPNLTAIAAEFDFNDEERDKKLGGDIAVAFWILGVPAAFLIGCLADQSNRSVLFALTVGIGEGACLATFFSRTYPGLYVCRAITGFSVGGSIPLIYSILGDLFVAGDRHAIVAIVGMGTGLGIALGQGVAGFLGPTFGWRVPFLVISIPALICAAVVLFTVQDPERGAMEQAVLDSRRIQASDGMLECDGILASYSLCHEEGRQESDTESIVARTDPEGVVQRKTRDIQPSDVGVSSQEDELVDDYLESVYGFEGGAILCGQDWRTHVSNLILLLSSPTVVLSMLQGAPGCIPWGIVNTYLNDFMSEDRGMSVEGATVVVLSFGIGNFFGLLIGGAGGRYLYKWNPRYPPLLAGSMALLGCLPFWLLLNTVDSTSSFFWIGSTTILAGLGSGVTGPIVKATLQNVTLPTSRGQAFAMFNTFDDFGRGLGPVFVAMMIVNMGGRTQAFNVGVLGWVVCGILNLAMFFTVARDERKVQAIISASLHQQSEHSPGRSDKTKEEESRIGIAMS